MNCEHNLPPILVDTATARHALGDISKTTLWRIVASGNLKPVKLGRKTLFRWADIKAYATSLEIDKGS